MGNGKKRALAEACEAIKAGAKIRRIAQDYPTEFTMYHNGLKALAREIAGAKLAEVPDDFAPEVTYVWGKPGAGKTRYVRELEKDIYVVPRGDKYKWKDGYMGHDAVLYDNIEPDKIDTDLLMEIDRYSIQVPVKGGFVDWRPRRIYLTSIHPPEVLAERFSDPLEFTRRITDVKYISK